MLHTILFTLALIQITQHTVYATNPTSSSYPLAPVPDQRVPHTWLANTNLRPPQADSKLKHGLDSDPSESNETPGGHKRRPKKSKEQSLERARQRKITVNALIAQVILKDPGAAVASMKKELELIKGLGPNTREAMTREQLMAFLVYFGLRPAVVRDYASTDDIVEMLNWLFEWAPKLNGQQPHKKFDLVAELRDQSIAKQQKIEMLNKEKERLEKQGMGHINPSSPRLTFDKNCFANRLVIACWEAGHKEFNKWVIYIFMQSNDHDLISAGTKMKKKDIELKLEESKIKFQNYMQRVYSGGDGDNTKKAT